jgi:hypothetical protein
VDREHQSSQPPGTPTVPAEEPAATTAPPAGAGKEAAARRPSTSAPDIMSRLPKTRPQRASERRRAPTGGAKAPGRASPASSRKAPATPKRTAAPRKRAAAAPESSPSGGGAPSLPRLAVDGAAEAVKLPLKVGGRLTLRALDAVARGLRRS